MKPENFGGDFDDFLRDDGIYEDVVAAAIKRVVALQIKDEMKRRQITKSEMAERMHTSRAALDRLLDPDNTSLTLSTLGKAAQALGKKLRVELE
ncbi:MAG: helix-turn-helix transcriptional regulator [Chloroflexi bacterium]|nr:helix-turn-helix transcriptional regulator [Chloroflexota bacterium]